MNITVKRTEPTPPPVEGVTIELKLAEAEALAMYLRAYHRDPVYKARTAASKISYSGIYTLGGKLKEALA